MTPLQWKNGQPSEQVFTKEKVEKGNEKMQNGQPHKLLKKCKTKIRLHVSFWAVQDGKDFFPLNGHAECQPRFGRQAHLCAARGHSLGIAFWV